MNKDAFPLVSPESLKTVFFIDNKIERLSASITILKLLGEKEIYYAPGAISHYLITQGLGVEAKEVGYPARLWRKDMPPVGLKIKHGGNSLEEGYVYNKSEEVSVFQQLNEYLSVLSRGILTQIY